MSSGAAARPPGRSRPPAGRLSRRERRARRGGAHALPRRYVLRLVDERGTSGSPSAALETGLAGLGSISQTGDDATHYLMSLEDGASLGDAFARIRTAGFQLLSCRDERSEVEEAFLALTRQESA